MYSADERTPQTSKNCLVIRTRARLLVLATGRPSASLAARAGRSFDGVRSGAPVSDSLMTFDMVWPSLLDLAVVTQRVGEGRRPRRLDGPARAAAPCRA